MNDLAPEDLTHDEPSEVGPLDGLRSRLDAIEAWARSEYPNLMPEALADALFQRVPPNVSSFGASNIPNAEMHAFIAGWFSHARNPLHLLPEDAWHAYRLVESSRALPYADHPDYREEWKP
jgi:hypothetical protein